MKAARFTALVAMVCAGIALADPKHVEIMMSRSALEVACAVAIVLALWSRGIAGKVASLAALAGAALGTLATAQVTGSAHDPILLGTEVAAAVSAIAIAAIGFRTGRVLTIIGALCVLGSDAIATDYALDTRTAGLLALGALGRLLLLIAVLAPAEVPASDDQPQAYAWVLRGSVLRLIGVAGALLGYKLGARSGMAMALGGAWIAAFACGGAGMLRAARSQEGFSPLIAGTASLMCLGFTFAAALFVTLHVFGSVAPGPLGFALVTSDLALLTAIAHVDDKLRARVRWLRWAYIPMLMLVGVGGNLLVSIIPFCACQVATAWYVRAASQRVEPGLPPARIQ